MLRRRQGRGQAGQQRLHSGVEGRIGAGGVLAALELEPTRRPETLDLAQLARLVQGIEGRRNGTESGPPPTGGTEKS